MAIIDRGKTTGVGIFLWIVASIHFATTYRAFRSEARLKIFLSNAGTSGV